jgi:hypothetical protein
VNPVFSTDDRTIIRSAYRARDFVIFDPCEVVFQAQVSAIPSAPDGTYLQIAYDTVSTGAFGDIKTGQMVIISETTDHTIPVRDYRDMRISKTPTASILYINESGLPLALDYYITVVDTRKPLQRVRAGTMVDGIMPPQGLPATITGLPSAIYIESTSTGTFDFAGVGIQTFTGITVSSTLYDFPGGSYDTGAATDLDPIVTMPADSHTWCRLSYVLSNGVTNYMDFQFIVQDPANPTLATLTIDQLTLNRTWQGHHATCRAFAGVAITQVMNGTRAVIVSRRKYKGGALDGEMPNVSFVGYLSKENNSTPSRNDKSARFDLVSIWERAGQLPFNPIAVRDVASPTTWDEINLPTAQRVVTHVLARYSTILNLCSLNLDTIDSTWYGGDMDLNASSLGDAVEQVLSEINAVVIQNPSGELFLRRDLRFEDDTARDAADSVWTLTEADLKSLDVTVKHDETTGRVIIGFRGYQTSRVPSKGGKAVAPAVILGTSPETQTRNNQLMSADLTDAQLIAAARVRNGNLLAAENPPFEMSGTTRGNLSWLNTSCHQWITISLPPSVTTRGVALSVRALLISLEISYLNREGDHDLNIELLPETKGGGALIVAALSPNVSGLSMFVLPPMPAYGGNYGGPSTLNGENQRFNRQNMGGMGVPIPPKQSYEDAQYAPEAGKKKFAISFANSASVGAGFTSVLSDPYTVTVSGSAGIETADSFCANEDNFSVGTVIDHTGNVFTVQADFLGSVYRIVWGENVDGALCCNLASYLETSGVITSATVIDCEGNVIQIFADLPADVRYFLLDSAGAFTVELTMSSGGSGTDYIRFGDAFYSWAIDEETGEEIDISLLGATRGFFIEGITATGTPPPYSPTHEYTFEWEGTGNIPDVKFEDTNYSDNANLPLYVTFQGSGVDS